MCWSYQCTPWTYNKSKSQGKSMTVIHGKITFVLRSSTKFTELTEPKTWFVVWSADKKHCKYLSITEQESRYQGFLQQFNGWVRSVKKGRNLKNIKQATITKRLSRKSGVRTLLTKESNIKTSVSMSSQPSHTPVSITMLLCCIQLAPLLLAATAAASQSHNPLFPPQAHK